MEDYQKVKAKEFFELWKGACLIVADIKPWNSPFDSDKHLFSNNDAEFRSISNFCFDDGFFSPGAIRALYARINDQ